MQPATQASAATPALPALLRLIATSAAVDGVILLSGSDSETAIAVASYPAGFSDRSFPQLGDLLPMLNQPPATIGNVQLPSAMTRWLGGRARFIALHGVTTPDFNGCLLFCWRDAPGAIEAYFGTLEMTAPILAELVGQHAIAFRLGQLQEEIDAVMQNVSIGIAITGSTGNCLINPIAADLLSLTVGNVNAADLAQAMTAARGRCKIQSIEAADLPGQTSSSETNEYWVFPDNERVVLVESQPIGDTRDPGRFWAFTDVKPLWTTAAELKTVVGDLQHSNQWLESEVKRRLEAEAQLRRHAADLQISHKSVERRAKEATELAAVLELQKRELEISKQQSDFLANHDPLTGLMNRRAYKANLERMVAAIGNSGAMVAVMFIDLDKFKSVNDTLGHDAGDTLLKAVAGKLKGMLRETDIVARFGGDEFAVATPHAPDQKIVSLRLLADRIREALQIPVPAPSGTIEVCGTLGIAVAPYDGSDIDQLQTKADQAMYAGKRQGRNVAVMFSDLEFIET